MIPSLEDLLLLDLGCLILHEAHDEDRLVSLRERIEAEREQHNPVIVSPYEDRYLVLNGVGRAELDNIEGIDVSDRLGGAPLAEVETAGGETFLLSSKEDGLRGRVRALWDLRSFYPKGVVVRRVEPDGRVRLSGGEALIRYHSFTPGELAEIVYSGSVLPAGITRFRIQERVLGVR